MDPVSEDSRSRRFFIKTLVGGSIGYMLSGAIAGCSGSVKRNGRITLLQTTDVHCQIHPHDELFWEKDQMVFRKTGGYAHLKTLFDRVKKENPDTFIVDTGDMFQGSELAVKTTGSAMLPILNEMGYHLYLPGNWEVVYLKYNMQRLLESLKAPKICANMHHEIGNDEKGDLIFPPYYIYETLGVRIGFLGYTDPLVPLRQSPDYSEGIVYSKPEETIEQFIQVLKGKEKCDYIVVLAHLGLSQQIALGDNPLCKGVDYIFGGDTHERVRKPIQCKFTRIVEPGAFGSFVGKLDLEVKEGRIVRDTYELIEVDPHKYKADQDITDLIDKTEDVFREDIHKVIGHSQVPLYRYFVVENTIDTLITDALKWKIGTDIVFSNGFRFCPPRNCEPSGLVSITEGYLYDMLPVDSRVRTGRATGKQIVKWLEKELNNVFASKASERIGGWVVKFNGLDLTFNAYGKNGKRIQSLTANGQPIIPDKEYTICACERDGDPEDMLCRMKNVKDPQNTQYKLHDVLREYIMVNTPVNPVPKERARVLDAPQLLLSQVSGVDYQFC